ncbi:MAG: hypothetical protein OEL20_04820 [Sulfuritalea sp.]|nr:hypothetical protein [Sulfuritalea sp.]
MMPAQASTGAITSIAEADCMLADISRRYFDLGWDFAGYSCIKLPPDAPPAMQQGYEEGRRRLKPKEPTRFDRKWLGLRFGALRRNRVVASDVTPEFLAKITSSVCPVTTTRMTCATGGEMDWSVDRVFNNGGYADTNICIMSTKANKAKGSKLLPDVLDLISDAKGPQESIDGLTVREWMRLAAVMVGPHSTGAGQTYCLPQSTVLLPYLTTISTQMIQETIFLHALGGASGNAVARMRASCTGASERQLHRVVQSLRRKVARNRWARDVWLEPGVFPRFRDWYSALSFEQQGVICDIAIRAEFREATNITDREVGQWALLTNGYGVPPELTPRQTGAMPYREVQS